MKTLTPETKRLIKERFYRWVINSSDGKRLGWSRASERLKEITGVDIAPETLRQNFKPVSIKSGKTRREFSDPKRYEAIFQFLTDARINYMTEQELILAPSVSVAAAVHLDEFLNRTPKNEFYDSVMSALRGRFCAESFHNDHTEMMILDIHYADTEKLVTVTLQFQQIQNETEPVDTLYFSGWLTANNDGFIQLYASEDYFGDIRLYTLLQTAPAIGKASEFRAIALYEYGGALSGSMPEDQQIWATGDSLMKYTQPQIQSFCKTLTRER